MIQYFPGSNVTYISKYFPGPNAYILKGMSDDLINGENAPRRPGGFNSTTARETIGLRRAVANRPGPGHYEVAGDIMKPRTVHLTSPFASLSARTPSLISKVSTTLSFIPPGTLLHTCIDSWEAPPSGTLLHVLTGRELRPTWYIITCIDSYEAPPPGTLLHTCIDSWEAPPPGTLLHTCIDSWKAPPPVHYYMY